MSQASLSITPAAVAIVVEETRSYGRQRLETGGFFMAPVGGATVTGVALAGRAGIERRYNLFQ